MSTTIVTGLWDIKRSNLEEGWARSFSEHYLIKLQQLFKTEDNIIIFGDEELEKFVWQHRNTNNTQFILRKLDWFKSEFFDKIQEIRLNENWLKQAEWLSNSTQAKLEWYNPIVMSKMFLLNDAAILDKFDSTHLVWVDAGLTSTVHEGYFWHDRVIQKLSKYFDKFSFVCFPYDGKYEIHGFEYQKMCEYADAEVDKVARGGIFGGPKKSIKEINGLYYSLYNNTINNNLMGTEESLFTILTYKYPELIQYYEIENNGLLGLFFENLKNDVLIAKTENKKNIISHHYNKDNVAMYVLTYNSPSQFETLCKSFELYDNNILEKPKKFLLNNSTNRDTDEEYDILCKKYEFEEIHKDNLGICGGRQFIAEHSEENGFDYHMFFEDDMFFYLGKDEFCRNGFKRKIDNFYNIILDIIYEEDFDFLKWNFSEFFGDNTKQWAWHNVPEHIRAELFPENPIKIDSDISKAPFLNFKNIKSYNGVPYATGEIYYCNWPQIVSKKGNRKMFLETKWTYPYEQTWMSYIYQETIKNNIKSGILLATPTEHNRFEFYSAEERKEN